MVNQISLTYNKSNISRDILTNFLTENETALSFLPMEKITPTQSLLTLIHTKEHFKLGNLPWGHLLSYPTGTMLYSKLMNHKLLKHHFALHRCLILVDQVVIKNTRKMTEKFIRNNVDSHPLMYLAGLYIKQIINHKPHYFALLITQEYLGQEVPVVLNGDQLKFYLNPKTILDELTFLFHQHAYQQQFEEIKKEG